VEEETSELEGKGELAQPSSDELFRSALQSPLPLGICIYSRPAPCSTPYSEICREAPFHRGVLSRPTSSSSSPSSPSLTPPPLPFLPHPSLTLSSLPLIPTSLSLSFSPSSRLNHVRSHYLLRTASSCLRNRPWSYTRSCVDLWKRRSHHSFSHHQEHRYVGRPRTGSGRRGQRCFGEVQHREGTPSWAKRGRSEGLCSLLTSFFVGFDVLGYRHAPEERV